MEQIKGTRAQKLRNEYIRGRYPRQRRDGTWTWSSGPSSVGTLTPELMSPRSQSPEPRSRSQSPQPRSLSSQQSSWNWTVPAAGAATAATIYSTRRRKHRGHKHGVHDNSSAVMPYVSPEVSLPTSTTLTYDPAQGRLVGKNHPRELPSPSPGTAAAAGGSMALLIGTFAAATLAARKKKARAASKRK